MSDSDQDKFDKLAEAELELADKLAAERDPRKRAEIERSLEKIRRKMDPIADRIAKSLGIP